MMSDSSSCFRSAPRMKPAGRFFEPGCENPGVLDHLQVARPARVAVGRAVGDLERDARRSHRQRVALHDFLVECAAADDGRETARGAEVAVAVRGGSVVDFEMHQSLLRHRVCRLSARWRPATECRILLAFLTEARRDAGVTSQFLPPDSDGVRLHYLRHGLSPRPSWPSQAPS